MSSDGKPSLDHGRGWVLRPDGAERTEPLFPETSPSLLENEAGLHQLASG